MTTKLSTQESNGSSLDKLVKKFSSLPKLVRSVSWLKCFVHFMESKCTIRGMANKISLSEIYAASRIVIKIIQLQYFPEELEVWPAGEEQQQIELTLPNAN